MQFPTVFSKKSLKKSQYLIGKRPKIPGHKVSHYYIKDFKGFVFFLKPSVFIIQSYWTSTVLNLRKKNAILYIRHFSVSIQINTPLKVKWN